MIFTKQQIDEILNIIEYHHTFLAGVNLGLPVLSPDDLETLTSFGVNLNDFNDDVALFDRIYYFGKLSAVLRTDQTKTLDYKDFKQYMMKGQYTPLTSREKLELDLAKRRTYTHLKGLKDRVKLSVEGKILDEEKSRALYEETIKEKISEGVKDRKSITSVISEIGHKLDTWKHDWSRIVETESQNIYNQARAEAFKQKEGEDVRVWKQVYKGACRHCIRLQLTSGLGSKPIVKLLKQVVANGTNFGKKVEEWKFVVDVNHPYCRCDLRYVPARYEWNDKAGRFELPARTEHRVERKSKIKITVGDKVFEV